MRLRFSLAVLLLGGEGTCAWCIISPGSSFISGLVSEATSNTVCGCAWVGRISSILTEFLVLALGGVEKGFISFLGFYR